MEYLKLITFLKNFLAVLFCFFVSFFNYLITQIIGGYFFPLTSLAVFFCLILNYQIPVIFIFAIGLTDDILLNSIMGTYALLYSLIAYFLNSNISQKQKRILNLAAVAIFLLINYLTFHTF